MEEGSLMRLREALSECDADTREFLAPIISLQSVQQVLLTFLEDHSKTFAEWVWDPNVRTILSRLRDQQPVAHHQAQQVDRWFQQAHQDKLESMHRRQQAAFMPWIDDELQGSAIPTTTLAPENETIAHERTESSGDDWFQLQEQQVMQQVEQLRLDGKQKFQHRDFYPALNAYKRCLTALQSHHQDPLTQQSIAPPNWSEPMKDLYVTCCCNVAICALKLRDLSGIREFSTKALEVDPMCCKALYSLAKLHMLEHLYEEAYALVDRALQMHPKNRLLMKFRQEIGQKELDLQQREEEFTLEVEKHRVQQAESERQDQLKQQEYEQKLENLVHEVPLPELCQTDTLAASRLHTYMMKIKHHLVIEFQQLFNPDNGEPPLFGCDMLDAATDTQLAENVQATSKKVAKNLAARLAILKLWEMRHDQGLLSDAEQQQYAKVKNGILQRCQEPETAGTRPDTGKEETTTMTTMTTTTAAEPTESESVQFTYPIRISHHELLLDAVPLLNQLTAQNKLNVRYEFEDLSREMPEFRCISYLNGALAATATAISKKKARIIAANDTFRRAIQQGLLALPPKDVTLTAPKPSPLSAQHGNRLLSVAPEEEQEAGGSAP